MKKLLVCLMCITMILALMPVMAYAASNKAIVLDSEGKVLREYEKLSDALGKENEGLTVQLTADVTSKGYLSISKSMTLDLNGHSITNDTRAYALRVYKAKSDSQAPKVTIKDSAGGGKIINGSEKAGYRGLAISGDGTVVTLTSGVTVTGDYAADVQNGGKLVIEDAAVQGVTVGVAVWGHEADETGISTLEIKGGTVTGANYGIAGNGNVTEYAETSIIVSGGTVKATKTDDSTGIFHPQDGNLLVTGGEISGVTGIEMRGGDMEVTGGTVRGGSGEPTFTANGSGSTSKNVAIAISQHATKLPVNVSVSGGDISGAGALIADGIQNGEAENVGVSISGGAFLGQVKVSNNGGDISVIGGAFTALDRDSVKIEADASATFIAEGDSYDVIGSQYINAVMAELKNSLTPDELVAVKVEINAADEGVKFVVPDGLEVKNMTDSEITVNDSPLASGDTTADTSIEKDPADTEKGDDETNGATSDDVKQTDVQKTGDENDMFLWLAVMALMACAGAALRKKEE